MINTSHPHSQTQSRIPNTSQQWHSHFVSNLKKKRINWNNLPQLTEKEKVSILKSLQAWQLGETSDGSNLIKASKKYSEKINDPVYVQAVEMFIKEEQKHGSNLGRYLDMIDEKRISYNWGDSLFRRIRYYNNNMEIWTLAVISVESTAQVFYQALKDATNCKLLKEICTDILIDEAHHIDFQLQRLSIIYNAKSRLSKMLSLPVYTCFFLATSLVVWYDHRKLFVAGKTPLYVYWKKMKYKQSKIIRKLQLDTQVQKVPTILNPVV